MATEADYLFDEDEDGAASSGDEEMPAATAGEVAAYASAASASASPAAAAVTAAAATEAAEPAAPEAEVIDAGGSGDEDDADQELNGDAADASDAGVEWTAQDLEAQREQGATSADSSEHTQVQNGSGERSSALVPIQAAFACGLPPSMSSLELACLPEFSSYSSVYLQLRNILCLQWQQRVLSYLDFDTAFRQGEIDPKLRAATRRVFRFLVTHGFINCGLLPIKGTERDAPDTRPKEQKVATATPLVRRKSLEPQTSLQNSPPLLISPIKRQASDASTRSATTPNSNTNANGVMATATQAEQALERKPSVDANMTDAAAPANAVAADPPMDTLVVDGMKDTAAPMEVSTPAAPISSPSLTTASSAASPFKRVLVIGAGASGLAAARQLKSFGHTVIVLEARERNGGRVNTIRDKFSAPVDLGASIMTGLYGSPLNVLCKQLVRGHLDVGFSTLRVPGPSSVCAPHKPFRDLMHYIAPACPIYDPQGKPVSQELDQRAELTFNKLLESNAVLRQKAGHTGESAAEAQLSEAEKRKLVLPDPRSALSMSVESGMNVSRRLLGLKTTAEEDGLIDWHAANLEYGCATPLNKLDLANWDQDDALAWQGDHALIKPGFGAFIDALAVDIDIVYNQHVVSITYPPADNDSSSNGNGSPSGECSIVTRDRTSGEEQQWDADIVVCTASLGVLKAGELQFSPPLPSWKQSAISSLGFGLLNKLILEFPSAFWKGKNNTDMFGSVHPGGGAERGKFYIFWNLERSTGRPILAALCAGEAALSMESESEEQLVKECMSVLRRIHSEAKNVPEPVKTHQTKWSQDVYARGSYSFVAVGNSGKEYDILAKPVGGSLYFAGEACCGDYPATVPGAYLSGLRAAGLVQARVSGWDTKADPEVLKELAKQEKSLQLSSRDNRATEVTNQAATELRQQGGDTTDLGLQIKIAEILARQQRRRRGMRAAPLHADQEDLTIDSQQAAQRENLASKLAAAADMLKRGLLVQQSTASLSASESRAPEAQNRYAHIKRYEGAIERPFDARQTDLRGLPAMASFSDFDINKYNPDGSTNAAADASSSSAIAAAASSTSAFDLLSSRSRHRSSVHSSNPKNRALARSREKRARSRDSSKRSHKKQKRDKALSASPEALIARYIKKVVMGESVRHPGAVGHPKLLKQVRTKVAGKVYADWSSKPRGSLPMRQWLNDNRRAKIKDVVNSYLRSYVASRAKHSGGGQLSQQQQSLQPSPSPPDFSPSSNSGAARVNSNDVRDRTHSSYSREDPRRRDERQPYNGATSPHNGHAGTNGHSAPYSTQQQQQQQQQPFQSQRPPVESQHSRAYFPQPPVAHMGGSAAPPPSQQRQPRFFPNHSQMNSQTSFPPPPPARP